MYGAILGDLAGSIYEYNQTKNIESIELNKLIEENSFISDDTILTIAILEAILENCDYNYYLKKYANKYKDYIPNVKPYFKTIFSPGFTKWAISDTIGTSHGNGAMMRISPVGYMFDTEKEVIENAKLATVPSHNSQEAISSATLVALIIYNLRKGLSKEEVYKKLNIKLEYIPFKKFNMTCEDTLGNCLYAFYHSTSLEDAIRRTIRMGGDTDTNACIVGSMAEALYGVDEKLKGQVNDKLPEDFVKILKRSNYVKYKRI